MSRQHDQGVRGGLPGSVELVAYVDSCGVEFVGLPVFGDGPCFALGGEGVGVEVDEVGGSVGVPCGEDCCFACANVGGGFASVSVCFHR